MADTTQQNPARQENPTRPAAETVQTSGRATSDAVRRGGEFAADTTRRVGEAGADAGSGPASRSQRQGLDRLLHADDGAGAPPRR